MNFIIALLVGVLGGIFGAGLGIWLGGLLVFMLKVPLHEGAAGYFVVSIAVIVGLLCLLAALVFALQWRGIREPGALIWRTFAGLMTVFGVWCLIATSYNRGQELPLNPTGPPPLLLFEIMAPTDALVPGDHSGVSVELQTGKYRPEGRLAKESKRTADGRTLLIGEVDIYSRTGQRTLVLSLPNGEKRLFRLRLPANPTGPKYREWSVWQTADLREDARAEPDFELRHQVMILE